MKFKTNRNNFFRYTLSLLIIATVSACGGGGGSATPGADQSTTGTTRNNSTTTSSTASASGTGGTSGSGASGSTSGSSAVTACGSNTGNPGNLVISTTSCQAGTQGSAYGGCSITASGGTPPYHYCVSTNLSNPALPEGMALDINSGIISSALIGGQGNYIPKIIVTDSAVPNNMAIGEVSFSISGNNAFLATIFPANSIFHHRVDAATTGLPVDTSPAAPIDASLANTKIQVFFGNRWGGKYPWGDPAISVPYNQPMVNVSSAWTPYRFTSGPIPAYAPIEPYGSGNTDAHVIVYRQPGPGQAPALYEMYQGAYAGGPWTDTTNVVWSDTTSNALTPLYPDKMAGGSVSAGVPNGPTLVNADEVIGSGTPANPTGAIQHPIRIVLMHTKNYYVWPATMPSFNTTTNCYNGSALITQWTGLSQSTPPTSCTDSVATSGPFGEIYRLKASVPTPACAATNKQAAVIITALRNYGVILGDNGTDGGLAGTSDARWNDSDLVCVQQITLGDLEPVNVSSLMISNTSGQTSH